MRCHQHFLVAVEGFEVALEIVARDEPPVDQFVADIVDEVEEDRREGQDLQ